MFKKILVPIDGSDFSTLAAQKALFMALKHEATITLLHVIPDPHGGKHKTNMKPEQVEALESEGHAILQQVRSLLETINPEEEGKVSLEAELSWGHPADVIIEKARLDSIDMIVMGSRGLGALSGLLLGSVSDRVSKLAPCPVLIVREE